MFGAILVVALLGQAESIPRLDRLERLAQLMDRVPEGQFNIAYWGTMQDDPDKPDYRKFVGCAAGWGTMIFASEGFKYARCKSIMTITYGEYDRMEATQAFFGLDSETNRFLFTAAGDAGTDQHKEAVNIRSVIRRYRELARRDLPSDVFMPTDVVVLRN
jgi:hypothetical protein